ncbi:MAG: tRNA (adenosine(37)-N6)-threonylcarbamoyltransferase complex ATPase subunit type 1 TsaE [Bacteroidales bacterium]|nr:tRNA (adenosine(37)-N6)-threonylcarbamoyltransferase complex ATPase subunit type 1 TsaE [Bacteroidales bacterium]
MIRTFPEARVFAFYGSMGAGKTTFIKALCRELNGIDIVQSPSFSLINEYKTAVGESIFHFDLYRINKLEEVFDIGYEDYIYSGSYCFLEWPELIENLLPPETIKVSITENRSEGSRIIGF